MARTINPPRSNTLKGELRNEIIKEESFTPEPPVKKTREKKEKTPRAPKAPKEKRVRTEDELARLERRFRVFGLFSVLLSFYLLFSFTSYLLTWENDYSFTDTVFKHFSFDGFFDNKIPVENWMGKIGALTGYLFISKWFGVASFFFVVILFNSGMKHFFHITIFPVWKTLEYCFFGIIWLPILLALVLPGQDLLAGVYGFQLNIWLTEFLGTSGLAMLLGFTAFSFLILSFNIPFRWFQSKPMVEIPIEEKFAVAETLQTKEESEPETDVIPAIPVNYLKEQDR